VSNYYDPGTGDYVALDGNVVERDALRIAEAIRDYDENLVLLCLDPDNATGISDEPFVVAERGNDGVLRPVLRAWVLDDKILERLYNSDTKRFDVFNALVSMENKQRLESQRRYQETREETKDIVSHIAGMKSKYTVKDSQTGEMMIFYDDRPAERR
jgi:hypothetical protein